VSALLDQQIEFSRLVGKLLEFAYANGFGVTLGDAYRDSRCPYGHRKSLHRSRLAIDLNLFKQSPSGHWDYFALTADHTPLGEYWESLDSRCRWGGRFNDGNHYSMAWEGMS
jgi:hypothetical protein